MNASSEPDKSSFPAAKIAVALLAVTVMGALLFAYSGKNRNSRDNAPKISRYGMIQDFSLTDHREQPFGIKDVAGKVWVANFIFTSCATECPLLSRRMQDVQEAFINDPRVELVSISVDPRTDNPKRLAKYAEAFKAGDRWAFLTGDTKEIERLSTKGFMVTTPGETPEASSVRRTRELLHSEKIAVVDQLGVVRFYANGMNPGAAKEVTRVVRKLLESSETP
ncbi:MAG: SCO family protein [Verrucomicrobiales bacterium]|nr:SCO family protein [Verrucomicrobiales bacterium]